MSDVALVYGFWGQNIGNAFFNVGGHQLLEETLGAGARIHRIQDQPGYRTFHRQARGNPPRDFGLLNRIRPDAVVLQGPMLTETFRALWEPAFEVYAREGIKVVLLGAALFKFTPAEIEAASAFLRQYPPAVFVSRDHDSYEVVAGLGLPTLCYDGIDSAFFAPRAVETVPLADEPFVTFTFDRYPEPTIDVRPAGAATPAEAAAEFTYDDHVVTLTQPALQRKVSGLGKWQAYFGHVADRRTLPTDFLGRTVVRPEHRHSPHMTHKIYQHANACVSDEPYTYLTLYRHTDLTLSDRVHACVATLAYGKPAMLFTPSPRSRLFDRLDLAAIRERPVSLPAEALAREQEGEMAFLRDAFVEIGLAA